MNENQKPTWYILGAGAIGCLWASYFQQAGFPVVLIVKKKRTKKTLILHNLSGSHQCPVEYTTVDQLPETISHLLVSTKAQQTSIALDSIEKHIHKNTTVLVLQNGITTDQLQHRLISQYLYAGVTTDGAYRTNEYTVVHAGVGRTLIGAINTKNNSTDNTKLIQQLPCRYLTIESCKNIKEQQWKKLALNCVINGLTAIYQCRNGELLTNEKANRHVRVLCEETFHIIHDIGITIADSAQSLYNNVHSACTLTANNYSSMYQDIQNQRPTEIDFLNVYLCEMAKKVSANYTENQHIVYKIKQLEQTEQQSFNDKTCL